ncbi:DUF2919 domain-containing protein [Enterovibrio norvegicus]|uniref:DUF2919 domain-containing protein n=2 Tax=Enterovibrio norvegicus TaxID=188144 RepID=A0A2N7L608_9GAMM|nr:DUF2919 domain-containing protein [Enterovibrio norvegicus]PMN67233.1 hypothetical protein BCT27_04650 [Enterovibrio norvegicus]PMN89072.1 hypothetical protein BCT23_06095 [Enterovibrio norvegicus]
MNTLLYQSPDYFDKHGNAKPALFFWLACIFLARAWIVFVIAGVSREQGADMLALIYPNHDALYMGLAVGFPSVALMLMAGNLHRYPRVIENVWHWGRAILLAAFSCDLVLQIKHLTVGHWRFHWSSAVTLLIALWLVIYLLRSRRIQFLFASPIYRETEREKK